jgi:hypothetical protein
MSAVVIDQAPSILVCAALSGQAMVMSGTPELAPVPS